MGDVNSIEGTVHGTVVQAHFVHGDVHVHPSVSAIAVPRQLPRGAASVVGRDAELAMLNRLVAKPGQMAVISGTAGIGKTALCLHWARSVANRFPDGQLHVDLRGFDPAHPPLSVAEAVRGFLDGFAVPPDRIPSDVGAQVNLYRSVVADRQVLVVLDNARDVEQVRSLLPGGPGTAVVITSRTELTGLVVREGVRRIGLGLLGDEDARQLITCRLEDEPVDVEGVAALAAQCGGLPLALAIVAGQAAQRREFPLGALVEELRTESRRLDVLDTGDPYTTVRTVFSWSYHALPVAARRLFRLLGLHAGVDIALMAAASVAGLPVPEARAVLAELTRANLAEEHLPGRFRFHDLLREYAAERLVVEEPDYSRKAAARRLLDSYLHTAVVVDALLNPHRLRTAIPPVEPGVTHARPVDYEQAVEWCAAEHHVVVGAVGHAVRLGLDRHAWQLAWALVTYLRRFGHDRDREATQRVAMGAALRLRDRYAEAKICRALAKTLVGDGRYSEATVLHERAIVLFREIGDPEEQADALLGLARANYRQGRTAEAEAGARSALTLAEAAGNTNLRAAALTASGRYKIDLGAPDEAVTRCATALTLYREIDSSEGMADALRALGSACHRLGRFDEAVEHYEASLELDLLLGDEFYAAQVLAQLGDAHRAVGRTSAAIEAWRRALVLFENLDNHEAVELRARLRAAENS